MAKVSKNITGVVARWGGLAALTLLAVCMIAGFYCSGSMIARGGFGRMAAGVMGFIGFLVAIAMVGLAMANEIKAIRNGLK